MENKYVKFLKPTLESCIIKVPLRAWKGTADILVGVIMIVNYYRGYVIEFIYYTLLRLLFNLRYGFMGILELYCFVCKVNKRDIVFIAFKCKILDLYCFSGSCSLFTTILIMRPTIDYLQ